MTDPRIDAGTRAIIERRNQTDVTNTGPTEQFATEARIIAGRVLRAADAVDPLRAGAMGVVEPATEDWWLDALRSAHSWACDEATDSELSMVEPWRKLSAYDVQRMADLLARRHAAGGSVVENPEPDLLGLLEASLVKAKPPDTSVALAPQVPTQGSVVEEPAPDGNNNLRERIAEAVRRVPWLGNDGAGLDYHSRVTDAVLRVLHPTEDEIEHMGRVVYEKLEAQTHLAYAVSGWENRSLMERAKFGYAARAAFDSWLSSRVEGRTK